VGTEEIYVAKEFYGDDNFSKAVFEPEAAALKVLDHPNVVKTIEFFGEGEKGSVIVMEHLSGSDML